MLEGLKDAVIGTAQQGIQPGGLLIVHQGLVMPAQPGQGLGQEIGGIGILGIPIDRLLQLLGGGFRLAPLQLDQAGQVVGPN